VLEVIVDQTVRDARLFGDVRHPRLVETLIGNDLQGGIEDRFFLVDFEGRGPAPCAAPTWFGGAIFGLAGLHLTYRPERRGNPSHERAHIAVRSD